MNIEQTFYLESTFMIIKKQTKKQQRDSKVLKTDRKSQSRLQLIIKILMRLSP